MIGRLDPVWRLREAESRVILFDFTKGEARWITQDEAAERMRAQHERGVRMSCEGFAPLGPEGDRG